MWTTIQSIREQIEQETKDMDQQRRIEFHQEIARLVPLHTNYNGWRNYPTWMAFLYLTNDQETDTAVRNVVLAAEGDEYDKGDALKAWFESLLLSRERVHFAKYIGIQKEVRQNIDAIGCDLFEYGFGDVYWTDIARHFLEE